MFFFFSGMSSDVKHHYCQWWFVDFLFYKILLENIYIKIFSDRQFIFYLKNKIVDEPWWCERSNKNHVIKMNNNKYEKKKINKTDLSNNKVKQLIKWILVAPLFKERRTGILPAYTMHVDVIFAKSCDNIFIQFIYLAKYHFPVHKFTALQYSFYIDLFFKIRKWREKISLILRIIIYISAR